MSDAFGEWDSTFLLTPLLFSYFQDGKHGEKAVIHYRDQETITVMVLKDRVTCIFSTLFTDADDIIIGKVFMQAFSDVRGKNPQAPQVLFKHKEAPEELAGTSALSGDNVGYITFGRLAGYILPWRSSAQTDSTLQDSPHLHPILSLPCSLDAPPLSGQEQGGDD